MPLECYQAVAQALVKCFNVDGDLKVVVLDSATSAPKKEFRVYSKLLCNWSQDLANAIKGNTLQISGYSPAAVEAFLRFLYSGQLEVPAKVAAEAALLAETFRIEEPTVACGQKLLEGIESKSLFEMLEIVSKSSSETANYIKGGVMRTMFYDPEVHLTQAWVLPRDLLDQIVSSTNHCIGDYELAKIIIAWSEGLSTDLVFDMLEKHVQLNSLSAERMHDLQQRANAANVGGVFDRMKRSSVAGEYAEDLFGYLGQAWRRHAQEKGKSMTPFLGFWVNLIPPANWVPPYHPDGVMKGQEAVGLGTLKMTLHPGQKFQWFTSMHSIYVSGISFDHPTDGNNLEMYCSVNGVTWDLLWTSDQRSSSCRANERVRYLRLLVKEGQPYENILRVHGVVHTG
eukprot:TRINITY_DN98112_c0_g1_i1.p1 TRINITY_DN98112_c0_g1~~TRINITY_DN98112_c0_g1_i1.p1  ORF type:complete len:398 (+),score=52.24 TRINITY_DN98112_c0_g1_i1:55-1248(+)